MKNKLNLFFRNSKNRTNAKYYLCCPNRVVRKHYKKVPNKKQKADLLVYFINACVCR